MDDINPYRKDKHGDWINHNFNTIQDGESICVFIRGDWGRNSDGSLLVLTAKWRGLHNGDPRLLGKYNKGSFAPWLCFPVQLARRFMGAI